MTGACMRACARACILAKTCGMLNKSTAAWEAMCAGLLTRAGGSRFSWGFIIIAAALVLTKRGAGGRVIALRNYDNSIECRGADGEEARFGVFVGSAMFIWRCWETGFYLREFHGSCIDGNSKN